MKKALGILMLDTRFERPIGDVGNALSWPFPVIFKRVSGASVRKIIDGDDSQLIDVFVAAGQELIAEGATALTTSCGFLALRQKELAGRFDVPVATSSLLQIPVVRAMLPHGKTVGVITYDAECLTREHFLQVGASDVPPIAGMPRGGAFHGLIEGGKSYDRRGMEAEMFEAVAGLLAKHKDIAALIFECTNMPPFSGSVSKQFGLPVFDILTLGHWLMNGVAADQERDIVINR